MVKPRRASAGEFCRAASVPHAVGFKQQLDVAPPLSSMGNMWFEFRQLSAANINQEDDKCPIDVRLQELLGLDRQAHDQLVVLQEAQDHIVALLNILWQFPQRWDTKSIEESLNSIVDIPAIGNDRTWGFWAEHRDIELCNLPFRHKGRES